MPDEQPTVATKVVGPMPVDELVQARQMAAARYERARPLLRQALSLAKTYLDDGAPISGYHVVLRACTAVLEHEAQAGPGPWLNGLNAAPDLTAELVIENGCAYWLGAMLAALDVMLLDGTSEAARTTAAEVVRDFKLAWADRPRCSDGR